MDDLENPPKVLIPLVLKGNDSRLVEALILHAKWVFSREIENRIKGLATMYDGDSCSYVLTIDINDEALRRLANGVGVKLPEYRSANDDY